MTLMGLEGRVEGIDSVTVRKEGGGRGGEAEWGGVGCRAWGGAYGRVKGHEKRLG